MFKRFRIGFAAGGVLAAGALLLPALAMAHPGHDLGHLSAVQGQVTSSFQAGLVHPLSGLDHLLAMLAVGLWAALAVRRAWLPPLVFLVAMFLGAGLGLAQLPVPAMEPMIAASLLVLGLALAFLVRLPDTLVLLVVAGFAAFHGVAHGTEMPAGASVLSYLVGFGLATAALHALGVSAGLAIRERRLWLARLGGAGMACYGAALLVV